MRAPRRVRTGPAAAASAQLKGSAGEKREKEKKPSKHLHVLLYNPWTSNERDFGPFFYLRPRWEFTEADETLTIF